MTGLSTCAILLVAAVLLAALGWGFWAGVSIRRRAQADYRQPPASSITIAPPVRAELFQAPAEGQPGSEPSPEWVMERMMDEHFEPVGARGATDDDSAWL